MYKKSKWFVYIFVVNQIALSDMPYKTKIWHALSHEQYFSKYRFQSTCRCVFNGQKLILQGPSLKGNPFYITFAIYHHCYSVNQMTGFYMTRKLNVTGLRHLIYPCY